MAAPESQQNKLRCACSARTPLTAGWEGSAVLNHGSVLSFGCESFVFSIPDPFDDEVDQ